MKRILKESFVPVLLVIAGIFLLVYYSHYVADLDAEQVTVIEIPAQLAQHDGKLADVISDDEENDQIALMRTDQAEFVPAYDLLKAKQWQAAEQAYQDILKNINSSQARADLAYVYYRMENYDQALQQLDLALDVKPVYLAVYYYRAKVYAKMSRYDEAEKDYEFFIKRFPQHYYAHFRLGTIKFNRDKHEESVGIFNQAVELSSGKNKSKALYYLGKNYQHLGEEFYPKARSAYDTSIRIAPAEVNPRMAIASLLPDDEQGRLEAEEIYDLVLKLKPNESRAYSRLASIYKKQGRKQKAQAAYEKAVEFNPSSVSARYNLGLLLLAKKKWQEALDQFQAVVNLDNNNARAFFNLGRANYRLKNYGHALSHYQKALALRKGDYPEVAINLGLIYSAKKDFDKAIIIYKKALLKDPESAKLLYNLGLAYFKSDQIDIAMSSYQLAIKYKPKYAQAWYNVARIHSKNKKYDEAVSAYEKALSIKPGYRSAQLNMAVALTRLSKLDQAERVYRQVLSDSPRYFSAWLNLGLVLIDQQRYSEAEDVFYQASQLDAEDDKSISLLAKSLRYQDNLIEAEKYNRIALDMKPDNERYRLEYIRVLIQQRKHKQAKIEVNKGIKLFPNSDLMKKELDNINVQP